MFWYPGDWEPIAPPADGDPATEPDAATCACLVEPARSAPQSRRCAWATGTAGPTTAAHVRRALRFQAARFKGPGGDDYQTRQAREAAAKEADAL